LKHCVTNSMHPPTHQRAFSKSIKNGATSVVVWKISMQQTKQAPS
jgi:hypothetical protein